MISVGAESEQLDTKSELTNVAKNRQSESRDLIQPLSLFMQNFSSSHD